VERPASVALSGEAYVIHERMSKTWLLIIVLTFMVAMPAGVLSMTDSQASESMPDNELVDNVSGSRLIDTVTNLASYVTRAFYTNSCWNSSIYIHNRFAELGLWVYYQNLEVAGFQARNVVAVKNGTDPSAPQYLFGAHYDSVNRQVKNYSEGEAFAAPGADDDASGVAAVIELATVLRDSVFENTLKFVAFTGEESGLNGSSYFVQHEKSAGVVYANTAIMDMIGFRAGEENRAMIFSDSYSNTLASSIVSAIEDHNLSLSMEVVPGYVVGASDHSSFWSYGYPSLLVIEQLENKVPIYPYYHTSEDTPDHISMNQMAEITKAVLGGFLLLESPHEIKAQPVILFAIGISLIAVIVIVIVYLAVTRKVEV
jgi:Zn-dependent M28 family amino/carboxypeptidase